MFRNSLSSFRYNSLIKSDNIGKSSNVSCLFFRNSLILKLWSSLFATSFDRPYRPIIKFLKKTNLVFRYSKAPMAHKTNSQEAYKINFFTYLIVIKGSPKTFDIDPHLAGLIGSSPEFMNLRFNTNILTLTSFKTYFYLSAKDNFLFRSA